MGLGGFVLGSLILYLKVMGRMMFQVSGFYYRGNGSVRIQLRAEPLPKAVYGLLQGWLQGRFRGSMGLKSKHLHPNYWDIRELHLANAAPSFVLVEAQNSVETCKQNFLSRVPQQTCAWDCDLHRRSRPLTKPVSPNKIIQPRTPQCSPGHLWTPLQK